MSVRVDGISRHAQGGRALLDGVSLDVPDGAFVALVGPSGAGKTTLLRAIAGLDPQQAGSIEINGQRVENLPPRERRLGFVFQNYALFRHMTVARNVSFGLDVQPRGTRPGKAEIAARVEELLTLMQLPGIGGLYPHQLSGGQRQRVALARALATRPGLLLLDEPFGALDPMVRRTVRGWLRGLHDQLGLTTILVTHDQEEALDIADYLVVMQDGRIVQNADAGTLDASPATPFVMEFLGEALRFEGHVRDGWFVPVQPNVLPVPVGAADGPALALIRPHEALPRPGQGAAITRLIGHRNGLARMSIDLGGQEIEILRPDERAAPVRTDDAGLDITAARLFRDGAPLAGGHSGAGQTAPDAFGQPPVRLTI